MSEEFGNFATVIGRVDNMETKEIKGKKNQLGKLTLRVGDNNAYVDVWNPKKADKNRVIEFFKSISEGDKIQVQGSIREDFYNGEYQRKLNAFVSAKNGVKFYRKEDATEKFVAAVSGNIIDREMRYDNVERFDEDNIPILDLKVAVFDLFNPNGDDEKTKKQVIIDTMERYKEYLEDKDQDTKQPLQTVNKLIKKSESGEEIKALNKFQDLFKPNMYNISVLHLTAYKDTAEELAERADKHDNIQVGVQVNNYQEIDEFGFVDGYVNELEIRKIKKVNSNNENDDFLGDDW